uniref:Uncharacterized protein n=1 Tax=Compsopogon caeruleus TaxID=31354 RepID=A0A1Z1XB29_9RHOD|nr:hypothetical protein [Compsopogon caeruleus]ARX96059.1 hypothetical protein [Compsopogon caeruleus]
MIFMCICINCLYVDKCSTYYMIEMQHNKIHLNNKPFFIPNSPIVNVSIASSDLTVKIDWDIVYCLSFVESPGKWSDYYK